MRQGSRFLAAALLVAAAAGSAQAAPCTGLPNPIYVAGSSAVKPVIQAMGAALAGTTTLIYQQQGSCVGVSAVLLDTTPMGACAAGGCITGTGTYYDATGAALTCDLEATGTHVDIGVSDVYATSCSGVTSVPADVSDTTGPIQAMLFVVPKMSTQIALTGAEGYFVFGFGGAAGMAMPWLNVALQFIRNTGSGTQQMISRAIAVPAAMMKGTDAGGSGGVITMVGGSTDVEPTIGILSADNYDQHRDTLKSLAFKAFGQWYGYYADSTDTSFDKKNVRDGHYVVWGPLHMLTHTDGAGMPLTQGAQTFLDYMNGVATTPPAPFDILDLIINAHAIPQCAMTVNRTVEMGDLSLYDPPAPCGCYFESVVGSTSCTPCTDNGPCGTGMCRRGYCEAH